MQSSRNTKIQNSICVVLVLLTGGIRLVRDYFPGRISNIIICVLFMLELSIWGCQIQRRLLHEEQKKYLISVAVFLGFLIFIRTVKFVYTAEGTAINRMLWYLYYFPQIFSVLIMFFAVLHIGKPLEKKIDKKWKILYLPATLLVMLIMTNDRHQWAFGFPAGLKYANETYTHGVIYYAALIWMLVLFAAMLVVAMQRCALAEYRKKIWMPIIPLGIGLLYVVLFWLDPDGIFQRLFKMAEICCVVFQAFMEVLILAHLFPTNDNYELLWNLSSLGGGIMDEYGKLCYCSKNCFPVSFEVVKKAEKNSILLEQNNIEIKSCRVMGGYGYWSRDVSEIHKLTRQLKEAGDVLVKENMLLKQENRIKKRRLQIARKNELYDKLITQTKKQNIRLKELYQDILKNPEHFDDNVKEAAVLQVYCKRCANLILLGKERKIIDGRELQLAVQESVEYLKLYGVKTYTEFHGNGKYAGEDIQEAYRLFQNVLETILYLCYIFLVQISFKESIEIHMEFENTGRVSKEKIGSQLKTENKKAQMSIHQEQETVYIDLAVMKGENTG